MITDKFLCIESHYLPSVCYFSQIKKHDLLYWPASDIYKKQTFRNHCTILTANGILSLTVPVQKGGVYTKDVKIDYSQGWVKDHLRAMQSAYAHAPYFEFIHPYIEEAILKKPDYLLDLNQSLLTICLMILKFKTRLCKEYVPQSVEISDLHGKIEKKTLLLECGYKPIVYRQVFGTTFVPHASIIDLLYNMGTDSDTYL